MEIPPTDRRILDALKAEIDNPATSDERRAELREELGSIATGYVLAGIFDDDEGAPSGAE